MALNTPSVPGPPWIGIFSAPRCSYWWPRSGASSGIPFERRSVTASGSAWRTCGLLVLSPLGVWTGSLGSKAFANTVGLAITPPTDASARDAKRRKSSAPRLSRLSCTSQARRTGQAALTSTGPLDPGRVGLASHIATSWSRNSSPAYWRLANTMSWRLRSEKRPVARRSATITRPDRVRSERAVRSSPMIRANPVNGCLGFESQ